MPQGERRLQYPDELWPQERRLCRKAAEGRLLDLRCRVAREDDPSQGRRWGSGRRIRAQVIFHLLTGQGPGLADTVAAVRLRGVQIVGPLNLGGWKLRCPLELSECYLQHRLDLANAELPSLNLRGSHLRSKLSARRLHVVHTVNLTGASFDRGTEFRNAHIGGQLDCTRAVFNNPRGAALNAELLTVDAHMSLSRVKSCGEVQLPGARIGGQLDCSGAVFSNQSGPALNAESLTVETDMVLSKAVCTGEVRLVGAHIKGQLSCIESTLCEPHGLALNAEGLAVGTGLYLGEATCTGEVKLAAAQIGGQLNCVGTAFSNPGGHALTAHRVSVAEDVLMGPKRLEGGLYFTDARVGTWRDKKNTWPHAIDLNGFVYSRIDRREATIKDRLRCWLPKDGYLPQPYEQLAAVLRREGEHEAARKVLIGKQRARRAAVRQWWRRWPSVAWSAVLRWTIGYGYRPALALIPLALLLTCGSVIFAAAHPEHLRPGKSTMEQPGFNSFRYTMDLLLPVANFKQRDAFIASEWAAWVSFGFIFAGWLLAAIVVAGLSGVFKRD